MKNPIQAIEKKFNKKRRLRPWGINHFGGFKAGKYHPLSVTRFDPDEAGTVSTSLDLTPAPVNGYLRSKAYAEIVQVWVPYQASEALELDTQDDAGVTEMTRRRLLAGQGIGLEDENVISQAAYSHPRSVGGVKKTSKTVRLAYIAAINHLRRQAYYDAAQLDKTYNAIAPAVLTANVLQRFDGVLDPEKLVDGAINLTGALPVTGITRTGSTFTLGKADSAGDADSWDITRDGTGSTLSFDIDSSGNSSIQADLGAAGEITLRDMMESKLLDGLVRQFARMVKADPLHGETAVARAIYGLQVDFEDDCAVLYRKVHEMVPTHIRPMDGASMNDVQGQFRLNTNFTSLVPRSELGGQLVTLVALKPMETLTEQPDPHQTRAWQVENRVLDELQLDEVLLTRADLESELTGPEEDTPVFWVGHNKLRHGYMTAGPNKHQTNLVEQKSSMWIYPVPTSVTPANISYPDNYGDNAGDMYPFANWSGDHCEYTISQRAMISTPLNLGPNPVEKLQLFEDDPTLITG